MSKPANMIVVPVVNPNRTRNILLIIAYGLGMLAIGFHYGQWSLLSAQNAVREALGMGKPTSMQNAAPVQQSKAKLAKESDC